MSDMSDDSPLVRRVAPAGVVMAATMLPPPEGGYPSGLPRPLGNSPPSIATADVLRSKVAGKSRSRQGSGLVSMTADGNEDFPRDCPQDAAALIVPQDSISHDRRRQRRLPKRLPARRRRTHSAARLYITCPQDAAALIVPQDSISPTGSGGLPGAAAFEGTRW